MDPQSLEYISFIEAERVVKKRNDDEKKRMERKVAQHKNNERSLVTWLILKDSLYKVLGPHLPKDTPWSEDNVSKVLDNFLSTLEKTSYSNIKRQLLAALEKHEIPLQTYIDRMSKIVIFCMQFAENYKRQSMKNEQEEPVTYSTSFIENLTNTDVLYVRLWNHYFHK